MNKHTITTRIVYKKGFMLCTNGAEFLLKQQKRQGFYIIMNKHTITTRIVYKKGFMLCTNGAVLKQQKLHGL
jgi:aminopeptidase N